jgi:hypothetical protein
MGRTVLKFLLLLILAFVASACSYVPEDKGLEQTLRAIELDGRRVTMRDLTDFQWDTLYLIGGYEKGSDINDSVGGNVMPPGAYTDEFENLLVFDLDGKPVRQASVSNLFDVTAGTRWPADVQLVATPHCGLVLVQPEQPVAAEGCM